MILEIDENVIFILTGVPIKDVKALFERILTIDRKLFVLSVSSPFPTQQYRIRLTQCLHCRHNVD